MGSCFQIFHFSRVVTASNIDRVVLPCTCPNPDPLQVDIHPITPVVNQGLSNV